MGLEDLDIQVENGTLTLKGERKFEKKEEDRGYHRIERSYGSFVRAFALPDYADAERVAADYKDGVLTVTVPKKEVAKPRAIKVNILIKQLPERAALVEKPCWKTESDEGSARPSWRAALRSGLCAFWRVEYTVAASGCGNGWLSAVEASSLRSRGWMIPEPLVTGADPFGKQLLPSNVASEGSLELH
ncbi:MAG: Hsp20/alpha crystallin family protein [Bryobacterales bacterium]|nr:Hsp20/alpha crystallin family protein [Bryobacterales bacterium]